MKISFVHKFKIIISIIWESFHFFSRIFVKNFSVHIIAPGDDNFDDAKMCLQRTKTGNREEIMQKETYVHVYE